MSKRILRINRLIRRELSQILLKEVEFPSGVLVTITRVETSPDLRGAKVHISCIPEDQTARAFQILNRLLYTLQQRLNSRLKMRPVPKIKFIKELKTREAGRIEELLEKIKRRD